VSAREDGSAGRPAAVLAAAVFAAVSLAGAGVLAEEPAPAPRIAFNRFYDYDQTVRLLRELVAAYPRFLRLASIGKSVEGRDMWMVTVANPDTGPEDGKSAMYIDANIHGNEVQGTEVCLYTIQYLMERYPRLPRVKALVDERVFYILPMVNPDGRAYWFAGPNTDSSSRSGKKPIDDDGDGAFDEDGYDDIDGDGEVLVMWKPDPHGNFRRNRDDPRLLERVKPGDAGEFIRLGLEGLDNDGDGRLNEDPPGGYDMNRNWPGDWQPEPIQNGAGDYPLSWPETRAIAEFILSKPNIAGLQAFHNAGGMILRGPGDQALGEYPAPDVRVYEELGQTGEFMLPFYRYMILWRDLYKVHGGFIGWAYEELGIFSFTNELWNTGQYRNIARPERGEFRDFDASAAERLKWDDLLELEEQFIPLKPARHPLYGEIYLGGFRKTHGRTPPLFLLEELCHRNAVFTLYHASEMPKARVRSVEVERLAGSTFQVTVTIENQGAIPTRAAIAAARGIGKPDLLEVSGAGITVLSGGRLADRFQGIVEHVEREPHRLRIESGIPGKGAAAFRFLVRGEGEATIRYRSEKGGRLEARAALR
jgi:hypothetical protein